MLVLMTTPNNAKKVERLNVQITAANGGDPDDINTWKAQSGVVLRAAVGDGHDLVGKFEAVKYTLAWGSNTTNADVVAARRRGVQRAVALLQAAITDIELSEELGVTKGATAVDTSARTRIFIVHGHDDALKEAVARFPTAANP
jgi:hypothetical protein